jgi:glycosyltransferase involved in cell wall biosynthesis
MLIAPEMSTLGGFEGQLRSLACALAAAGNRVDVVLKDRPPQGHRYVLEMGAAGVAVHSPARAAARRTRPVNFSSSERRFMRLMGPVILATGAADALLRRRKLRRSLLGVRGVVRGAVRRALAFDAAELSLMVRLDAVRVLSRPEIVDVQHSMVPVAVRWAVSRQLPVVYTEYGAPSPSLPGVWSGLEPVIGGADGVIGRAAASIEGLRRYCGLDGELRTWVVENAVAAAPAGEPAGSPHGPGCTVAMLGRLSPEKGPEVLLRAVADLVAEGLPVRLVFGGDGPQRGELSSMAVELGVEPSVDFIGVYDDPGSILRRCHIVAHPTYNDGRSVSVLEAMAWGRPVVASNVGGIPEIIVDRESGLLVPPGDPSALGDALRRLVVDRSFREYLGRGARAAYQAVDRTPEAVASATYAIYEEVVNRRRSLAARA